MPYPFLTMHLSPFWNKLFIAQSVPLFIVMIALASCSSPNTQEKAVDEQGAGLISHATKLQINKESLTITEPWPGAAKPKSYPLHEAPKRVIVTSTTHIPYLEMLGVTDRLVGFPNTKFISSPTIQKRVSQGKVRDIGPDGDFNLEVILSLQPDLIVVYDMGAESNKLDKFKELGIPFIYNADFLETSALGRAEWIKFFGALFDKQLLADSIFSAIAKRYDSLSSLVRTEATEFPTILSGIMYGDTWFMPGGQNWAAGFFKDAGGNYLWADNPESGWLEASFESVLSKAEHCDYWIGTSTLNSREALISQDERYTLFQAYRQDRVFNYSKRISPDGGYDFFESAYARPDLVLGDLVHILHPELLPEHDLYYFESLK